jgi:hypothetical protein
MKPATCFLALNTARANGMPLWRRRCLAKSAGSCQALSVVRSLSLSSAPALVPRAVEEASLSATGVHRRQTKEPCGRRAADRARGGPYQHWPRQPGQEFFSHGQAATASSTVAITIPAAHSIRLATRQSQPWPGSTARPDWIIAPAAGHGATHRVRSMDAKTPNPRCWAKPLILQHRSSLRHTRTSSRGRGILARNRR